MILGSQVKLSDIIINLFYFELNCLGLNLPLKSVQLLTCEMAEDSIVEADSEYVPGPGSRLNSVYISIFPILASNRSPVVSKGYLY